MKLLIKDIVTLHDALQALNGRQTVVKQDNKDVILVQPYDFGPKTRWNLAKNLRLVSNEIKTYSEIRDSIIRSISGGQTEIDSKNRQQVDSFLAQMQEIEKKEIEVDGILTVNISDLKVDENKLSPAVLAGLMPIVVE